MKLTLHPYRLEFVFPFRIAHGTRTHTDALFVELECNEMKAFGEATFPPYLPHTLSGAIDSISSLDMADIGSTFDPTEVMQRYTSNLALPVYAALEMALWILKAKLDNTTVGELLGIDQNTVIPSCYTIAVCDKAEMANRLAHGRNNGFKLYKLKLDGKSDRRMLTDFRSLTDAPFAVDANQAWTDIGYARDMADELEAAGCVLIEQPFDKSDLKMTAQLRLMNRLPLIADEACQIYADIDRIADSFSGINIKLHKCGGLSNGLKMIDHARSKELKVLIGCMSESAVG
jgi:L-alanine-DL-glutamate epimerase-like enolase superfamily enzyme